MKQLLSVTSQLGPLLQAARKSSRLSQSEVASRLGISQSRMSAMELNPGSINLDQLLALCGILGLELIVQSKDKSASSPRSGAGHNRKVEW
jgi:HTH-type transcriptional regulator/antitoxin HipB